MKQFNPPQSQIGPYVLDKELGRGGMGAVYRARHQGTNQIVAVKILIQQHHSDHARSLIDEALTGKKLDHPNCLKSYEILSYGPHRSPAIISEYIEGLNLREFLDSIKYEEDGYQFSPLSATLILEQLFMGLRAAHKAGLIHQDVKPENYLIPQSAVDHLRDTLQGDDEELEEALFELRNTGWLKLSDWGLSILKERDRKDNSQSLSISLSQVPEGKRGGTIVYMPLEQIDGVGISRRTDIFALSLIYYELLTGQAPVSARSAAEGLTADTFEVLQNYLIKMISSTAVSAVDPTKDPYLKPLKYYPQIQSLLRAMSMRLKDERLGSAELEMELDRLIITLEEEPVPSKSWALYLAGFALLLPVLIYIALTQFNAPAEKKTKGPEGSRSAGIDEKKTAAKTGIDKVPNQDLPKVPVKKGPAPDLPKTTKHSPEFLDKLQKGDGPTIRALTHIDGPIGRAITNSRHSTLRMVKIESMTPEGARELAKARYHNLDLGFKKPVENFVMEAFGQYKGPRLTLSFSSPLTKENAEALSAFSGESLIFRGPTPFNATIYQALASSKVQALTFSDVKTLKLEAALLSAYSGTLAFPKLTNIGSSAASGFSRSKAKCLRFINLKMLKPKAAIYFSLFKGENLTVGLPTLQPDVADALARFKGKELVFRRTKKLTIKAAKALKNCQAKSLQFSVLEQMNAVAAKELAQFGGDKLVIWGSVNLDPMHGLALSQFTGSTIDLKRKRAMNSKFLQEMQSYPGQLLVNRSFARTFQSYRERYVKARPPWEKSVLSALKDNRSLAIMAMSKMPREAAIELQNSPGQKLVFQSLTELDFLVAGHLARANASSLSFPSLKTLSKEARAALFRFKGQISINGKIEKKP